MGGSAIARKPALCRPGRHYPPSGGGLDFDWERFEAEFRAYEQRLRV